MSATAVVFKLDMRRQHFGFNLGVCGDIWEVTQRRFSLHDSHHCLHAQDENGKQAFGLNGLQQNCDSFDRNNKRTAFLAHIDYEEKRVKLNPWTVPICIQHDGSQSTERTTFSETRTTIPRKGAGRRHVKQQERHNWLSCPSRTSHF